jgi:hypothetical protein
MEKIWKELERLVLENNHLQFIKSISSQPKLRSLDLNNTFNHLFILATINEHFEIVEFLLQQGVNVSYRVENASSAFEIVIKDHLNTKKSQWFALFSLYKSNFDEKDLALFDDYKSTLSWDMCNRLIQNKDYKQLQVESQKNPDIIRLFREHLDLPTAVFLESGDDPNKKNTCGGTPMMFATSWRKFNLAQYLLQQGADISLRDSCGNSIFDFIFGKGRGHNQKERIWFELFGIYKEHFDEKDQTLYNQIQLSGLYAKNKKEVNS